MPLLPAKPNQLLLALTQKHAQAREDFAKKHEFAKKWFDERGLDLAQIRQHSTKLLTGATLSSALLLSSPVLAQVGKVVPLTNIRINNEQSKERLRQIAESILTANKEEELVEVIKSLYGVSAAFELDRNRLPAYTGLMGLEQHLVRFLGDTTNRTDAFPEVGMAPSRGAFGYFYEEGKPEKVAIAQEKYYIVLQTFVIPTWNRDWVLLKNWYKFRKFIVINPENGRAVVASLGDSGPATWTGKVFGGSPEVMHELGFYPGKTRGNVVVLYLDDPGNEVPLGPLTLRGGIQ